MFEEKFLKNQKLDNRMINSVIV